MYTPLKFVEQVQSMVRVQDCPSMAGEANAKCLEFADKLFSKERLKAFNAFISSWCQEKILPREVRKGYRAIIDRYTREFQEYTGLVVLDTDDFANQMFQSLIANEWSATKRSYKVSHEMMDILCEMNPPDAIPVDVLTRLPMKCFYIDFNGYCPFCSTTDGMFVTYDSNERIATWQLCNLITGERIRPLYTNFGAEIEGGEKVHIDYAGWDDWHEVVMHEGESVYLSDRMLLRFFTNFCLYLYSANNDVEYSERTKKTYVPRSAGPSKARNVEEFNVGFRVGQTISTSKKRYKSTPITGNATDAKRGYSSNFRCAHWHHYWVNDAENPGSKKLIVKWLEGTFVKGNKEHKDVVIHNVKK